MADDNKHSDQFNASLPLPGDDSRKDETAYEANPAAELIRKKVNAAYEHEPAFNDEAEEVEELKPKIHRSKHQQFIYELTNSGRPLHEIQTAWHEYYAGLTDREKHQVWQEFYNTQAQTARHPALSHGEPKPVPSQYVIHRPADKPKRPVRRKVEQAREHVQKRAPAKTAKRGGPLHSLLFGLGTGCFVILIFMFSFFNDRLIAPFIQPSRNTSSIPIILNGQSGADVGPEPEIIIPKINVQAYVVYGVTTTDETTVEKALQIGVVHYADTATPGEDGNVVIVGHSSGNIFNGGQYKFVFSLLRRLNNGDTFYLQKDYKRYTYQVYEKEVVKPTDVSVLAPNSNPATATLITCDPPGVSTNRLVVLAKQIDPDPAANTPLIAKAQTATAKTAILPSDSPTLWSRLVGWFKS